MQQWFLKICIDLSKNLEYHVTIFVTYVIILTTNSFQNIPNFENFVTEITERQIEALDTSSNFTIDSPTWGIV